MSFFNEKTNQFENILDLPFLRNIMAQVYIWMALGLMLTAGVAFATIESGLVESINGGVILLAFIVELGLVIGLRAVIYRISPMLAVGLFFLYAAINGFTLSLLLMIYTSGSVVTAFVSTGALFAAMSIIGMTTKADLTKMGTYLFMGLIGLFIAMIVNLFLASTTMDYIISVAGVIIFVGLTAYDTQKINHLASQQSLQKSQDIATRISVIGALILYLDFLNLFIFILRLTGNRR